MAADNFSFLPWQYTTAIIGGLSGHSQYSNSVRDIIQNNYFTESEVVDLTRTMIANAYLPGNYLDEIGDHIGKIDIAQSRYFTEAYDMNDLLMLPEDGGFVRYDDWSQWYDFDDCSSCTKYPRNEEGQVNSCVGLLFIEDDINNVPRKNACILELNMTEIDEISIHDSSGNYNSGVVIGDYSLKKDGYNKNVTREEPAELPEIENDKLAF